MVCVERSKIDDRPVSTGAPQSYKKLTMIQMSKFHVGYKVYASIRDHRGPYLIAKVVGGGNYILCHYNGYIAESGNEIGEKYLVAA